jgi:hypothetical protein
VAEDLERPRFPWPTLVVGGLAIFGAIALVKWVVGTVIFFAEMAVLVVIVVAVLRLVSHRGR